MLICLIFPIYINNLLLDRHNHILEQFFYYDSCICSKQNKYQSSTNVDCDDYEKQHNVQCARTAFMYIFS